MELQNTVLLTSSLWHLPGAKQALLLLAALYQKQPAATIEALSWVLTPDADQDITCRVEAAEGELQHLSKRFQA